MMDVVFVCRASPAIGFGHLSRCMKLAALMSAKRSLCIAFVGSFSEKTIQLIGQNFAGAEILPPQSRPDAQLAVIDTMYDSERPELVDQGHVESFCSSSRRVVFMASGLSRPCLPRGVVCIGYKLGDARPDPPFCYWSLDYAPAMVEPASPTIVRDPGRVLVALGGGRNATPLRVVTRALALVHEVTRVDVLVSPMNTAQQNETITVPGKRTAVHAGLPSLAPLLRVAELAVVSYGHTAYEAIANGCAVCVLGQKKFQAEYALQLERAGLAVAAGLATQSTPEEISELLRQTYNARESLQTAGQKAIDGRGLERTVAILLDQITA